MVLYTKDSIRALGLAVCICLGGMVNARAAIYYVDGQHGNDGNTGQSVAASWRTLGKANSEIQPGDTVYIREGTYGQTIRPDRSGTQGNYITYARYNDEEVVITNVSDGADLRDRHYIRIDGLKFLNVGRFWVNMNVAAGGSATHNIIQNCHMEEALGWAGFWLEGAARYNKILNNTIIGYAGPDDLVYLRGGPSHNVIEGNDLRYGAHNSININVNCLKNVIRNNRVRNPWHSSIGAWRNSDQTLIEGNVILDSGEDHEDIPTRPDGQDGERQVSRDKNRQYHHSIQLGSSDCIIRNNLLVNNGGMELDTYDPTRALRNRIYHNTFYRNSHGLYSESGNAVYGNVIKNNILKDNTEYEVSSHISSAAGENENYYIANSIIGTIRITHLGGTRELSYFQSTYPAFFSGNTQADPLWVDPGAAREDDNRHLDRALFHLRSTSPLIDAGRFLAETTSSGSGTLIPVNDARCFYDGWGIPGEQGDLIQLAEQDQAAQIVSIDYQNNRITVDRALSWSAGQGVSLPYHGSAPDIGAFEYVSAEDTTYTLSVSATNGSVTKTPNQGSYSSGTTVTLQATANSGYEFAGWSGDLSGSTNPVTITMNGNKSVIATFAAVVPTTYTLSVSALNGSVAKTPNQDNYTVGATVTLQATANSGYEFTGWSGDLSGSANPATITMNANKSVTANFTAVAPATYTLSVTGTNGSIAKTPNKVNYTHGETVTLTAMPNTGYRFTAWSGDLSGSTNPVSIAMNSNKSITAGFAAELVDERPPVAIAHSPAADAVQVPRNSLVTLYVSDEGRGVDPATVVISIDGTTVYSGDVPSYDSAAGVCRRMGAGARYTYTHQSETEFAFGQAVTVRVNAADLNGNIMGEYVYSFKTEMWAFGGNRRVSWGPEGLDKGHPVTACDRDGNLWAAWHAGSVGQRDIYLSRWGPADEGFADPIRLTSDTADQANPDMAIGTDGKLYVVWQDNRAGNWNVYLKTSPDGINWSAETRITDSDNNQTTPAIAVHGVSSCHVAWEDDADGHLDIHVASSSNSFLTGTVTRVTSNSANQRVPAIAVDASGNVYLVWVDARNGSNDIYGATSIGGSWTNAAVVTRAGSQTAPVLATEAAGAWLHLVWVDELDGSRNVRYAAMEGLPSSPLLGVDLADDTSGADQLAPTLATVGSAGNGLRVFVCWQDWRNATPDGQDTDLYYVEVKEAGETNVFVGDGGTGSGQSEPAVGVDSNGFPYVVWADSRARNTEIYHAGTTAWDPEVLDSRMVTASEGGTVGAASPSNVGDVSVVIPPAASSQDVTITIARIHNPPAVPSSGVLSYELGPSGLQFSQPVTITIPYAVAEFGDDQPTPWWYDSQTGGLSQEGITDIEHVVLAPTVEALRFKTTHFTPYYLISTAAMEEIVAGSGGSGGGCSLSCGDDETDPVGYFIPYALIALVMAGLRIKDARRRARLP